MIGKVIGLDLGEQTLGIAISDSLGIIAQGIETFRFEVAKYDLALERALYFIDKEMNPKGVAVVVEAEHLCMTMRGIRAAGSKTQTSALRGSMRKDARTRAEVMTLLGLK